MKLVVTIPAQNEQNTIAQVVAGVPRNIPGITETEIIVINDSSSDHTADVAIKAGATVITVNGRPGLGAIFRAGLERAMRRGADFVCNIDGDGQFNPADIAKLVEPLLRDEADFVTCSRFADPKLYPQMPAVKFYGNRAVTSIINSICGGTKFTDVSCGFRAFNREAAYRLTLFGKFTYTQECFIDLFSKGMRIKEVPLKIRGVREHGKSRVASSIRKYAMSSLPIILRAMRDIQPLKFFGVIALMFFIPGLMTGLFVTGWYLYRTKTSPFTSFITISGVCMVLASLMGALALLADMLGRHRRITEELLYLARRRIYAKRTVRLTLPSGERVSAKVPSSMHDTWTNLPVIRAVGEPPNEELSSGELRDQIISAATKENF
ncbi:MAG TPA: glycosyltransferase [Tepidisphaeraceae bacterium]|nr:glycosyltransferase [Tepidisphaeraceae bacterium]